MSPLPRILTLRLKEGWWQQIRQGIKTEELRADTTFYRRMLIGRDYDEIHLWLGYPPKTELSKRLRFAWRGAQIVVRQHPFFGPHPVSMITIDLSAPLEIPSSPQPALL